ncbi:MAG: MarR family transcriptional regulator [Patescibacteria group bacterium]
MKKSPFMHPLKDKSIAKLVVFTATRLEQFANTYVLKPMGLTTTAIKIMGILYYRGPLTPTDILKLIGGTKSNVTQRLNFLEKSGFIKRQAPRKKTADDKRKKMIELTGGGKRKLVLAYELVNNKSLDLEKSFTKAECRLFYEYLVKTNLLIYNVEKEYLKLNPRNCRSDDLLKEICGLKQKNCRNFLN